MTARERKSERLALLILGGALALRAVGIWYGLPDLFNSDEPFNVANALSYGAKKSLEPTYFVYPTLYSYALFLLYGVYFLLGQLVGAFQSALDFAAAYFLNPTGLYLVGRAFSAVLGSATVAVTYLLGRRFFAREVGLTAALLLALSYSHADVSHWILLEPAVTFTSVVALYFIFRLYEKRTVRAALWAGLTCGLAVSTKYNAGFIFLPLAVCVFLVARDTPARLLKLLAVVAVSGVAGFLLGTPYWLFASSSFVAELRYTVGHVSSGMVGHLSALPLIWPLWQLVFEDWTVGFLGLAGLTYAFVKRDASRLLLLSFVVPTLLTVGLWSRTGLHYVMPVYPALAVLGALFAVDILALVRSRALKWALVILFLVPPLFKIALQDFRLTQQDSRAVARAWIESHLPEGSVIAYENYVYGPNLFDPRRFLNNAAESALLPLALKERLLEERHRRVSYVLVNLRKDFKTRLPEGTRNGLDRVNPYVQQILDLRLPKLSSVRKAGVRYLIVSSDNYLRYFRSKPPPKGTPVWLGYQNGRHFYESVFQAPYLKLVKEFRPSRWSLGPTIRIYEFHG